ncbi:MAG: S26 family signal peptidase [Hyphomicrobiales bacterium]|nr:S26 family signal peptidase [Hyphomicrobiales bacterium]
MFEFPTKKSAGNYLILMFVGCGFLIAANMNIAPLQYVWNASESLPKGLYRITDPMPSKGELVLVRLPEWVQFLANQRKYLPRNTPVLKRIYGVHGDVVCRFGETVFINQITVAIAKTRDYSNRKMPIWRDCKRLISGELFLLTEHPDSFDGRYFGVVKSSSVIGTARSVWLVSD